MADNPVGEGFRSNGEALRGPVHIGVLWNEGTYQVALLQKDIASVVRGQIETAVRGQPCCYLLHQPIKVGENIYSNLYVPKEVE